MELTAVSATQFSVAQLTTILCDCFEDYLVPVTLSVEVFVQRFSAEGLSLLDSCVWLDGDVPAAMAVVARRGDEARLAAFAVRPAYRGKGVGRRLMSPLIDALREQGVRRMWLGGVRANPPPGGGAAATTTPRWRCINRWASRCGMGCAAI